MSLSLQADLGIEQVADLQAALQSHFDDEVLELSGADKKGEGKAAGATGWLVKPFDPEQLLATIRKVLG